MAGGGEKNLAEFVRGFFLHIGEDPEREGLRETPARVIASWEKLFGGYKQKPADVLTVFGDELYDEMIVVKDIEFYSMCEHHLMPYFGKAYVGYIPKSKILGVSKVIKLVQHSFKKPSTQEDVTDTEQVVMSSNCFTQK